MERLRTILQQTTQWYMRDRAGFFFGCYFGDCRRLRSCSTPQVEITDLPKDLQNIFLTVEPDLDFNVDVDLIIEDQEPTPPERFVSPRNTNPGANLEVGILAANLAKKPVCNLMQAPIGEFSFENQGIAIPSANRNNQRSFLFRSFVWCCADLISGT